MIHSVGYSRSIRQNVPSLIVVAILSSALSSCVAVAPAPNRRQPRAESASTTPSSRRVDPGTVERLRRVMVPLFRGMNQPCRLEQTRVGIVNQDEINAANAGNCEFYVTIGLLRRATDDQLRGILAHELAHELRAAFAPDEHGGDARHADQHRHPTTVGDLEGIREQKRQIRS